MSKQIKRTTRAEIVPIKGAVVFPEVTEIKINGERGFKFPDNNPEYTKAIFLDGMWWASKDGKRFVVAIAIERMDGKMQKGNEA